MADPRLARIEALLQRGDAAGAKAQATAMLATAGVARADCRIALLLRAQALEDLKDLPHAIDDLRDALTFNPVDARVLNSLGILLADAGDLAGALEAFVTAVASDPKYARAWNNYGNALRDGGRIADAAAALDRAVAAQPDYALAWSNLGAARRDLGDDTGAEAAYRRSLALKPDDRGAVLGLGALLRDHGLLDEASSRFARAAELSPADPGPLLSLAGTCAERDEMVPARDAYARARARRPTLLRAAFGEALTLPMVYADADAVTAARAQYAAGLLRLEQELPALVRGRRFGDVIDDLRWTNFLLAYQGEDDRELQARYAGIVARAIDAVAPEWRAPRPRSATGARIRVGFASAFYNEGTVGMYFRRWIEGLDRKRFEIYVYHLRRGMTPLAEAIARGVDRFRAFSGTALTPSTAAPTMRGDALDILVYPELGMDQTSFALAALRLAPVQVAGWGHPVTTGHATIDTFLTAATMESADATRHYTEALVALPGIGTDYARPAVPADATRAQFGLPDGVPLLMCPQSLFKIHPETDALFARVLAAAPAARLVVFAGRHPALTAKYEARLAAACRREGVDLAPRLITLPQCPHPDYLRINAVCDAMLDTLRWSGGNTSLDALAAGLPVVTLPGLLMRGRQSAAMLALAGVDELVARDADDYVRIAVRVATDRPWRESLRDRIRAGAPRLFGDAAPVAALGDFLQRAVAR
ncbi:MAG: tetratricopeptide repeat protein [Betaproteobacteria bacterium]